MIMIGGRGREERGRKVYSETVKRDEAVWRFGKVKKT